MVEPGCLWYLGTPAGSDPLSLARAALARAGTTRPREGPTTLGSLRRDGPRRASHLRGPDQAAPAAARAADGPPGARDGGRGLALDGLRRARAARHLPRRGLGQHAERLPRAGRGR